MTDVLGYAIQGLLLGVAYGLIALPFGLTYSTLHVADAAVGSYAALGGIVAAVVGGVVGGIVGVGASIAAALVVAVTYRGLMKRRIADPIIVVAATFGFALAIESAILLWHGKDGIIVQLFSESWGIAGVYVNPQSVVNLVVGVLLVAALVLLLDRTSLGRQIRASADNDLGALLSGIPVVRLHYLVFVIEGLLAGIGGVLLVYTIGLSYGSGIQLTLTAFGAAIIFGLRGPLHGFLGGLVIGVAQGLVGGLTDGGFWSALPFIFVLAVLLLSPRAVAVERP